MARKTRAQVSVEPAETFAARLIACIRDDGPIDVSDYMRLCNAHYYATRDPFGAAGDFVTAPEISQAFGELIGAWCGDYWQRIGAPDPVLLVELGPGRGTLMADALRATRRVPGFHQAAKLHLVETSPVLRRRQQEELAAYAPVFHDDIADVPPGPLLLVANEFFDALPIEQYQCAAGVWHQRRVALAGDRIAFLRDPAPSAIEAPRDAPEGAIKELCPAASAIVATIAGRIAQHGGAALIVDYGYFPSALGDTVQAVRAHLPHPVLDEPGSADLTAHVDFAALATAAQFGGAACYGPVTQGGFLTSLGIAAREAALLKVATPDQQEAIRSGSRRLVGPAAMGALFKVLALGQEGAPAPTGFAP
jgi:NADH dehydrogenase [ubiquinone] 1 alpha subcomplex assembly factor 7